MAPAGPASGDGETDKEHEAENEGGEDGEEDDERPVGALLRRPPLGGAVPSPVPPARGLPSRASEPHPKAPIRREPRPPAPPPQTGSSPPGCRRRAGPRSSPRPCSRR